MLRKVVNIGFTSLIAVVLIAKMLNWFLNFSDETNFIINSLMFSLIGLAYIVYGIIWDKKIIKLIFLISGLYLIVMNFISKNMILTILGIICILTPILIIRFLPKKFHPTEPGK